MSGRASRRVRHDAELLPTRERFAQGDIVRVVEAIVDVQGERCWPYRGLDTLERMERAQTINRQERRAGDKFHDLFRRAMLDRLRAADPTRLPVLLNGNGGRAADGDEAARLVVLSALDALGGLQTETGSCAWYVLGCEFPLVDWAVAVSRGGRRVSKLMASGILLSDLQILRRYFGC